MRISALVAIAIKMLDVEHLHFVKDMLDYLCLSLVWMHKIDMKLSMALGFNL